MVQMLSHANGDHERAAKTIYHVVISGQLNLVFVQPHKELSLPLKYIWKVNTLSFH